MTLTVGAKESQPLKRFTFQNFNAGEIAGVNITLSKNQNGTKANNDSLDFISTNVENDGTPIIVLQSDYETGVNDSSGDRIKVNSISGTTVNLSAIPANNVAVAIWYRYLEPEPSIVTNSLEISPNIENNLLITLNTNKTSAFQAQPNDTRYPTEKLVKDNLDLKVNVSDIKDNLTSTDTNKPLSANQGKTLQDAKANKITNATNGNFIKQNANGDIVDTGVSGTNFNNANQLVKLNANGQLEALDGSNLTGITSSQPIGTIVMSIASSITGAIACDGSSRLKTDYSSLYALITAELGANALEDSNNSNNFILPNLEGRALGVAGGGRSLFDLFGSDTHTLTVNEMPSHKHDLTMTYHSSSGDGFGGGRMQLTDRSASTSTNPSEITLANTGGGQAHSIVQKTAYIAKKVFIYYQ